MRANRLFSLIFLLQAHGRQTAAELALALDVSERTIFRDINVLSSSGIPVYAEHGPGGGFSLLAGFQSSLTALNEDELRSLFVLGVPGPLADLQASRDLQGALRKISARSGGKFRQYSDWMQGRIHLDTSGWSSVPGMPALQIFEKAVRDNRKLHILQELAFNASMEREIDPLGLVARDDGWTLVFQDEGRLEAISLEAVLHAEILPESFTRPKQFNLLEFWAAWRAQEEESRSQFIVDVRVAPGLLEHIPHLFPRSDSYHGSPDGIGSEGWVCYKISFEHFEDARAQLMRFGSAVEVLHPIALRRSIADYAEQIVRLYD